MGITYTSVVISNPADSSLTWEGDFVVDTGAVDSLVPRDVLDAIGVKPKSRRVYTMADGSEVGMDVSTADMEIMGDLIGTTVVFGEAGTEPLLGAIAMQAAGVIVDPRRETLRKLPSIRL